MIYSVSRRTDIPAFYSDWFFNRLKEGFVDVVNPFNSKQVTRYSLKKEDVDCFVFWTKNATTFTKRLEELEGYNYYFQYTINGYGKDIEVNVPSKRKEIIENFKELSKKIGKDKMIWRYDPIILTDYYTIDRHVSYFKFFCEQLHDYTNKVVISFVDFYKKTERNLKGINLVEIDEKKMYIIAKKFSEIARYYNLEIATCSEKIDLDELGIKHNKCIDDELIYKLFNIKVNNKRDNQRELCGCVKCTDIGAYNTCLHKCLYCYANFSYEFLKKNVLKHNKNSSLLIGEINEDTKIHDLTKKNLTLFDL